MKHIFLKVLALVFCLAQTTSIFAQEAGADIGVTVSHTQATTIVHDNTMYMLPGEKLDIAIVLNEAKKVSSVKKAIIKFNSKEENLTTKIGSNNKLSIDNVKFTPEKQNEDYSLEAVIDYSIILTAKDGKDSIAERRSVYTHNNKMRMMPAPSTTTIEDIYCYDGQEIDILVKAKGGNTDNWSFNGEPASEYSYSFTAKAEGVKLSDGSYDNSVVANIVNYAPDGKTIWYKEEKKCVVHVFTIPTIGVATKSYSIQESESVTFEPTLEGGNPATWTYQWYKNGTAINDGKESTLDIVGINKSLESRTDTYYLVATNKAGEYEQTVTTEEISVEIAGINFEWNCELPKVVYEHTPITAAIARTGGSAHDWTYTWTNNGVSNVKNDDSYTFYATVAKNAGDSVTLTFTAKCDGFEHSIDYKYHVWSDPKVSVPQYTLSIQESESITLEPTVEGGNPDTWTYQWYKDGVAIEDATETTLDILGINTTLNDRTDRYKFVATNRLTSDEGAEETSRVIEISVTVSGINFKWAKTLPTDVVEGDEFVGEITRTGGGDNHGWTYTWTNEQYETPVVNKFGEGEGQNDSNTFHAPMGTDEGLPVDLTFEAECDDDATYYSSKTHRYTVWSTPRAAKTSLDDIALLHGQKYTFSIETEGGMPSGWKYEWYLDDKKINGESKSSYEATMQYTSNSIDHVYKVIATNTTNNIARTFVFEFNAEIWPAATETHSKDKQDLYYGESLTLDVNVDGGYNEGWTYEWKIGNTTVSRTDSYTYKAPTRAKDADKEDTIITLHISNAHGKATDDYKPLYEKDIVFTLTSWSHGEITGLDFGNKIDYRSEDNITVHVSTNGGYTNSWKFYWYYNGNLKHTTTTTATSTDTYTFEAEDNYGESYNTDLISVRAENIILTSGASKEDMAEQEFIIWPLTNFADDFTLNTLENEGGVYSIREGNTLTFEVEKATGGYNAVNDNYWRYIWYENNVSKQDDRYSDDKNIYTINIPVSGSNVKSIIEKKYKLNISNISPYNTIWYEENYAEKRLTIYSRPQTPLKLTVKGNGNSNTLVCLMDNIDDATLTSREYTFVFGYTDESGEDHFMPATVNRWYQFDQNVSIKNSNYTFWVCTQWDYDSQNRVTSGRRFLNGGKDDIFDASCFNNVSITTRGVIGEGTTSIDQVESDDIHFDGTNLIVNTDSPVNGTIKVLSLDGRCMDVIDLGKKQYFNETIDKGCYKSGTYIIQIKIGEILVNKKVLVP